MKSKEDLNQLMQALDQNKVKYTAFFETDINEVTAITIAPSDKANKLTSNIPLAGRVTGKKDKHNV